ncbi:RNA polymerase sigma factor [Steroidobacter sp.]|uniref:RNA polymerase sigma factor n=1 Tax=Steroidobacter sp. TaxID=1978227 RepID=UPI001A3C5B27|nr:sigma-70 family RNA polymerase sigma factor [Steroidobacter sp.]MBL8266806.1 sigma-70 family RNA polymerase sigma factor [Steroidobacter sp.]
MNGRLDSWFKREVLVHETVLMRFLARAWPNRDELADLRQEAYARICEASRDTRPQSPKAFLFSIAKHIMADRRRRERIVSIQAAGDTDLSNDVVDEKTPDRQVGGHQELARLARAFDRLPAKCRKVVWMRRVLEIPQREVARRLGLSERTVEGQVQRGSQLLAQYLGQAPWSATYTSTERFLAKESFADDTQEQDSP